MQEVEGREQAFWDSRANHSFGGVRYYGDLVNTDDAKLINLHTYALGLLGSLEEKRILDCGCGYGALSCHLAKQGARVTAIDISAASVNHAQEWFRLNGVHDRIETRVGSLHELPFEDASFDIVVGSCILHHLDLRLFGAELRRVLKPGGRAVFVENNAKSRLLMFFRNRILTALNMRRGSSDESPMDEEKLDQLRAHFPGLRLHYPEMVFFRLGASFFFQDNGFIRKAMEALDSAVVRAFPSWGAYSYFDVIDIPGGPR
ncbi:MAG: class I SAM-dependent methyltransferase [Elusimicrobiota bacterium]